VIFFPVFILDPCLRGVARPYLAVGGQGDLEVDGREGVSTFT
jgi:hypothetical protein